jgi:endonuclease YncB( thermonuclease family)
MGNCFSDLKIKIREIENSSKETEIIKSVDEQNDQEVEVDDHEVIIDDSIINEKDKSGDDKRLLSIDKNREIPPFAPLRGRKTALLNGIVDGDTLTAIIIYNGNPEMIKIRISGIDTPESKGETSEAGKMATKKVYEFFNIMNIYSKRTKLQCKKSRVDFIGEKVIFDIIFDEIKTLSGNEKFGRHLAKIYFKGESLGNFLIKSGYANPYNGGTKDQEKWKNK